MAKLRVLSSAGDSMVEWDAKRAREGDPDALAAVREAERIFDEHRARGATAFVVAPDQPAQRVDRFDPAVEHLVIVPRVAGG